MKSFIILVSSLIISASYQSDNIKLEVEILNEKDTVLADSKYIANVILKDYEELNKRKYFLKNAYLDGRQIVVNSEVGWIEFFPAPCSLRNGIEKRDLTVNAVITLPNGRDTTISTRKNYYVICANEKLKSK